MLLLCTSVKQLLLLCTLPQVLLLEVQSATAIYPATVSVLLHALSSAQRQQLADALLDAAKQQQHQQQYLQEPVQVPAWVQQVQQLSKWDVLLLLGLWGPPQWEADAGLVLLQGVRDMARCAAAATATHCEATSVSPKKCMHQISVIAVVLGLRSRTCSSCRLAIVLCATHSACLQHSAHPIPQHIQKWLHYTCA
jgi:hypothetical protein